MYISNLYVYQKSFEGPLNDRMWRTIVVHPVTQAQASEVWREVWEMDITLCFKGMFYREIFSYLEHCFVT